MFVYNIRTLAHVYWIYISLVSVYTFNKFMYYSIIIISTIFTIISVDVIIIIIIIRKESDLVI